MKRKGCGKLKEVVVGRSEWPQGRWERSPFCKVDSKVKDSCNRVLSQLYPYPTTFRTQKWPVCTEAGRRADLWLINPDQIKA